VATTRRLPGTVAVHCQMLLWLIVAATEPCAVGRGDGKHRYQGEAKIVIAPPTVRAGPAGEQTVAGRDAGAHLKGRNVVGRG
jgi:hypothetical protein